MSRYIRFEFTFSNGTAGIQSNWRPILVDEMLPNNTYRSLWRVIEDSVECSARRSSIPRDISDYTYCTVEMNTGFDADGGILWVALEDSDRALGREF